MANDKVNSMHGRKKSHLVVEAIKIFIVAGCIYPLQRISAEHCYGRANHRGKSLERCHLTICRTCPCMSSSAPSTYCLSIILEWYATNSFSLVYRCRKVACSAWPMDYFTRLQA
jgi:hypothetical protein